MPKVIDYTKYYSTKRTGRPRKTDYVVDGAFETYGILRARIHRQQLAEDRKAIADGEIKDFWNYKSPATFYVPSKTNNALVLTSVIWGFVFIFALLSFATK